MAPSSQVEESMRANLRIPTDLQHEIIEVLLHWQLRILHSDGVCRDGCNHLKPRLWPLCHQTEPRVFYSRTRWMPHRLESSRHAKHERLRMSDMPRETSPVGHGRCKRGLSL